MNNFDTVRDALEDADTTLSRKALTALAQIEANHAHDMASAAAQGWRDGVASVQQGEPVDQFRSPGATEWYDGYPDPYEDSRVSFETRTLYRAAPVAQQPQAEAFQPDWVNYRQGLHDGWAEGYEQGVKDERTSEANIGIAGFGAKVNPARENPYKNTAPQQAEAVPMSQPNRLIAYSAAAKLRELGYHWDEKAEAWAPQQAEAVPAKEDFCYCNDEISLQIVSGGGAPEGLYGRVTLRVNGEYVNYVRADSWQRTPRARALEFVARHKSSDWPERCQQMVDMARAALATPHHAEAVPPGYVLVPVEPTPEIIAVMAVQEASGSINGTKTVGMTGAEAAYDAMIAAAQGAKP